MNNDTERAELDATGKFHTVQPLRDLESNWAVDLAKNLEEYLLKICSGEITSADHDVPHLSVNFAEAALLLQGSVQVYSRKVEYLYSLVLHALEFISQKSSQEQGTSASVQSEESVLHAPHDEENDSFWGLDVPAEAKNLLDSANGKDTPVNLSVRPPANLVVLEGDCLDAIGDAGELESYLLATNDLFRDFILLDSCDAAAVDDFLNSQNKASKLHSNICRGSSIASKSRKSFQSPTKRSGSIGHKSAGKNQDVDVNNLTSLDHESESNHCNIEASPPPYDFPGNDGNDFSMENEYSEPRDSDDSDSEDPWKPLNPHEPGNLKVKPYKRVKTKRKQAVNYPKCNPITIEFPLARLDGPISAELTEIWEAKHRESQRQGETQSLPLYEQLRQSLVLGGNKEHDPFGNSKDNNEDNEYDSEDPDIEPPDFDMPDNTCMHEDLPQDNYDGSNVDFDFNQVYEDANNHASLEDLCRSHLDSLLASLAETEKQTELAARVSTWKQRIEQNLEEQESHPPFDIHEYGERVLDKLHKEGDNRKTMSFGDVVKGQEKHDVARSFSALLQLVNNGDIELERNGIGGKSFCYTAENPFYVHLLRNEKPNDQVLPHLLKKRAKSPKGYTKIERKKSGKENHQVVNVSTSVSTSSCRFSVKLGKPGGTRCTPEGKKRRKSRFVEQVNLHSPR